MTNKKHLKRPSNFFNKFKKGTYWWYYERNTDAGGRVLRPVKVKSFESYDQIVGLELELLDTEGLIFLIHFEFDTLLPIEDLNLFKLLFEKKCT